MTVTDRVAPEAAHLPGITRTTLHYGELVTLAEAASRLGKPESTVRRWLSERRFAAVDRQGSAVLVGWGDVVEAEYRTRQRKPRPKFRVTGT